MRFLKYFTAAILLLTAFAACKKNSSPVSLTPNFYFLNGSPSDTDNTLILFSSSDTITYNMVISSTYFLSSKVLVTVAASDIYRDNFNSAYGTSYEVMPAEAYSFKDTITASIYSIYDTIPVTFYKHALSPDKQYMLPIQIVDAENNKIDENASVIYLHTSNNTLSGIYNATGTRTTYNGDAADSNVNSTTPFSLVKNLVPVSGKTSTIDYADLGMNGWQYIIGFSPEDSSFFAAPNTVILNSVQSGSFKVLADTYDSTTNSIYIKTSYKNLSGDERIVEETLTLH